MKRIAIASSKGGSGKTTTAVGLAHALALAGQRVLLVDCDPRRHAALQFGVPADGGLAALLQGGEANATEVRAGLWVVNSGGDALLDLEAALIHTPPGEGLFRRALAHAPATNVVLFDCPPAAAGAQLHAGMAADAVVVPVASDSFGLEGCRSLLRTLEAAWGSARRPVTLLSTFYDAARESNRLFDTELERWEGARSFQTRIRFSDALCCAAFRRRSIFDDAPESNAARDYICLAEEIRSLVA